MTTTFTFDAPGAAPFAPPETSDVVSPTETDLVQNLAHADEAISHLIEFFRSGPRNQALLRALGAQVQEVEDALWQLYTLRAIDTAEGEQLDILGRIVGELRSDRLDEDYRAAIRVRILVNSNDGLGEQLISIALGIAPSADIELAEVYPAAISFVMSTSGSASLQTVARLLQQAKAAGVRLELTIGAPAVGAEDDDPLGGTIGAEDDNPLGFTIAGGT